VKLTDLNAMTQAEFVEALGWIYEQSPWVAERASSDRPFSSIEALHGAMTAVVERASREEQLALLRAHPELGTRARVSAASAGEQRGAGLSALTQDQYEDLATWGNQYREKFGFPFIYAVKGSTIEVILFALTLRLDCAPEEELHQALWEVGRIAWFRLNEALSCEL
jgi:OHCU decarboxylase